MRAGGVAAFDFDGTITRRDTLAPFIWRVGGPARNLRGYGALVPTLLDRDRGRRRSRAKTTLLRHALGGRPLVELEAEGRSYAESLPARFRPEALERITWHRDEGHELILVTASLRVYAEPAALALGFDHVIAVELATDATGRVTGDLTAPNVVGPEKERRLREHLGNEPRELWAYGNSAGDDELLAMADHPTWAGRRAGRPA